MADRLSEIWKQQTIVDNLPAAAGQLPPAPTRRRRRTATPYIGAASTFTALKGAPCGADLPIELPRDFMPIGFITQQPMFIAVAPQLRVNSLPKLIALAKSKPGELSYATTGRSRIRISQWSCCRRVPA
jgi:tripartite-type tricarboxylate transporter receptor subunit TctC